MYQQLGYEIEHDRGHPLADKKGRVLFHRKGLYDLIGEGPHPCFYCGKSLHWTTGRKSKDNLGIEVDHLDGDRTNNVPMNWVVSCTGCNTKKKQRGNHAHRVLEVAG